MKILRGDAAVQALQNIIQHSRFVCVNVDPEARAGHDPQLLAIAGTHVNAAHPTPPLFIVDVGDDTQNTVRSLLSTLAQAPLVAAENAKDICHILMKRFGYAPQSTQRWACPLVAEQIISGGRTHEGTLMGIGKRLQCGPVPEATDSLEALGARTSYVGTVLNAQSSALKSDGLHAVSRIETSVVVPLASMEVRGLGVDVDAWRAHLQALAAEQREILHWLYNVLDLPPLHTESLFGEPENTIEAVLSMMPTDQSLHKALLRKGFKLSNMRRHTLKTLPAPYGPRLARLRALQKLLSAYGERFLAHVHNDRRVHPTFTQIGASTGRMSCHDPNLQAMVKEDTLRSCLRAAEGHTFVIADYATCELRILAEMSGDEVFIDAFARNEDLHATVASQMFSTTVSKTENPHLRERAKAINFGLVYGMGHQGLARQLGIEPHKAQELISDYFSRFPRIGEFLQESARHALDDRGFASTISGRRFYFGQAEIRRDRAHCARIAKNMPIQGTSADIIKLALTEIHRALDADHSSDSSGQKAPLGALVNVVHDEVVVECPVHNGPEVRQLVQDAMQRAGAMLIHTVPMIVDVRLNNAWTK